VWQGRPSFCYYLSQNGGTVKSFLSVAFLSIVAGTGTAHGGISTDTGNDLAKVCSEGDKQMNADDSYYKSGICGGFIIGVFAASEDHLCPGVNVTNGQIVKIARKYLDDHPEALDGPSQKVIGAAFIKAFPCEKK
jgi:hypothetical protein